MISIFHRATWEIWTTLCTLYRWHFRRISMRRRIWRKSQMESIPVASVTAIRCKISFQTMKNMKFNGMKINITMKYSMTVSCNVFIILLNRQSSFILCGCLQEEVWSKMDKKGGVKRVFLFRRPGWPLREQPSNRGKHEYTKNEWQWIRIQVIFSKLTFIQVQIFYQFNTQHLLTVLKISTHLFQSLTNYTMELTIYKKWFILLLQWFSNIHIHNAKQIGLCAYD